MDDLTPVEFMTRMNAEANMSGLIHESSDPGYVKTQSKEYGRCIYRDYRRLRAILLAHQQTIGKRWQKKSKQNKLNIVLAAWGPDMPKTHRPDFDTLRLHGPQPQLVGTMSRSSYIWPQINQEDLGKPSVLPQMLYARASRPPADFAAMDGMTMHIGLVSRAIIPLFLNKHVTLLNNQDEDGYGTLIHWDEHEDAFEWMNTQKQYLPGEALLVLECQARIMRFLCDCTVKILHDVEAQDLTIYNQQAVLIPPLASGPSTFSTLRNLAELAPYRQPAEADFSRMTSLIAESCEAAKDHLWLLREDPDYFAHFFGNVFEHRHEQIKSSNGQTHLLFRTGQPEILWARVLGDGISCSLGLVDIWEELHAQTKTVDELHGRYPPRIGDDLHPDLLYAILKFRRFLVMAAKVPCGMLKIALPGSPPWRAGFIRSTEASASDTKLSIRTRDGAHSEVESYMLWLFNKLWDGDGQLWLLKLHNVMDEVQRFLDTYPEAKNSVSAHVSSILSDLAVLGECQRQVEIFQPWAREFETHEAELGSRIEREQVDWTKTLATLLSAFKAAQGSMTKYGNPSGGRFNYPVHKARTRENVELLRRAEDNLDEFWTVVLKELERCSHTLSQSAAWKMLKSPREIRRTPLWTDHDDLKSNARENLPPSASLPSDLHPPATPATLSGRSVLQETARRNKTKTKGSSVGTTDENLDLALQADLTLEGEKFTVDARSFKTFCMLFHSPNAVNLPGELPWAEFLHAMTNVGARAEKLYGSAWRFEVDTLRTACSIQIHEPHPSGKMSFTVARHHGRRLSRAFGWGIDSFVVAKTK